MSAKLVGNLPSSIMVLAPHRVFFVQPFSSLGFGTSECLIWDSFQMANCKGIIYSKFIMVMYKLSVILYSFYRSLKSNLISLMNEKYNQINTNKILYIRISFYRKHKHTVNKNQLNLVVSSSYVLLENISAWRKTFQTKCWFYFNLISATVFL